MIRNVCRIFAATAVAWFLLASSAWAQITTGTVTGRVVDSSGRLLQRAHVVMISETRGTRSAVVVTNEEGDYVFPDVTADTYTVEVTAPSFKTSQRTGIVVTGGDRVGVPTHYARSRRNHRNGYRDRRSDAGADPERRAILRYRKQGDRKPADRRTETSLNAVAFTPGVNGALTGGGSSARLGDPQREPEQHHDGRHLGHGHGQQRPDAEPEHRVDRRSESPHAGLSGGIRQIERLADYGRDQERHESIPRVRLRHFHQYSNWNSRSWIDAEERRHHRLFSHLNTYGYTIGGPVVIPKVYNGRNKLFFFYAHEFRPQSIRCPTAATSFGCVVPTALERAGDFSQSRDQNGNLIASIIDNTTGKPFPGNIIPQNRPVCSRHCGAQPVPDADCHASAGDELQLSATASHL